MEISQDNSPEELLIDKVINDIWLLNEKMQALAKLGVTVHVGITIIDAGSGMAPHYAIAFGKAVKVGRQA
jgi:hypothetical protein